MLTGIDIVIVGFQALWDVAWHRWTHPGAPASRLELPGMSVMYLWELLV